MKQLDLSLIERKLKLFFLFFAVFTFSFKGFSQVQTQKAVSYDLTTNVGGFYESLPVNYASQPTKKFPLIIFLHGAGEVGDGKSQIARVCANGIPKLLNLGQFPSSFTVGGEQFSFIVLSPQSKVAGQSVKTVTAMINYALANYRVDEQRIYLTGLSLGGFMSWNYAASSKTYADKLAALLLVCPGIDTAVNPSTPDPHGYAKNVATSNLPVWITTNSVDPEAYTYKAVTLAKFINAYNPTPPAKLSIFPEKGHDAWSKTYNPAYKENGINVYEWMLMYKRGNIVTPTPPLADAGSAQTITLPVSTVTLDGSKSTASSGTITGYKWTKVSGPASGTITNATGATTTVTGLTAGTYQFQLAVTNSNSLTSTATVTITVKPALLPPVANAGNAQTITLPTNSVTINGSASTAPSGTITTYAWTKLSGPATGTITSPSVVSTTVTGLVQGVYVFQLKVTDNNGNSSTASVTITVNAAPIPPVANAGSDQTIQLPVSTVTLDATKSTAPAGSISSYAWTKVSGPTGGAISTATNATTAVTGLTAGVYEFQVKITDNLGSSATDIVVITVKAAPLPPVANAGTDQTIQLPVNDIILNGGASTAPSGTITDYLWTKVSGPASGNIIDPLSVSTHVANLVEGIYQFQLKVTDNNGNSSIATVTVTVKAAPLPPVADAGSDKTITLPTNSVSLDGNGSTAPAGSITAYAWTKVSGPSAGTLTGASTANATAADLVEGVYKFQLKVTDNNGATSTATITVTVKAAPLPPVANAGTDQTITLPTNSVSLDGSGSTAPAGSITAYAWTKVSGPSAGTLTGASTASATAAGLTEGVYKFQLKVTDNNGATSTATVTVTVKAAPLPPVANAGIAQTITLPANSVTLDGSGSTAPSGTIVSYAWTKISGPSDGTIASASNVSTAVSGLTEGVYQFELKVTDSNGATATATVTVTVKASPIPPVADAGTDQTITLPTNSVSLDGSKSTAPSGTITTYAWTKVSGPSAGTLSGASTVNPSAGGLVEGVYQYELTVTDNNGASASATVTITVKAAPLAPVADAGTNQTITLPTNNVNLDGSKSTAPSGTITTYAWTKVSGPADGTIANASSAGTAVNDLVEGVYVFELKVTDNNGNSATSSVTITVQAAPLPPVADAGADQTISLPVNTVTLDGSASSAPSGSIVSYAWTKVSGPSDGTIVDASSASTSVNNLTEGVYQFELTITDNNGATATAKVTVTVNAAPLPPVANAGADQVITLPTNSVSLDGSGSTAPAGSITAYAWTKVSGPSAGTLTGASTASATAADLVEGVYKFQLKVTDNNGATSTATITVTVKAAPLPPVANAGSAQTITLPTNSVTLDGSGSTAPSGSITSYTWTTISGPAGNSIASASSVSTLVNGLVEGVYQFELKVTDNNGATSTATVTVTVKAAPLPPVANAGIAQTITLPANSVTLDGSGSTAPSGTIVSYAWTKISGPSDGTIASASNVSTAVSGLTEGVYQFELKVTDSNGATATATVTVTVKASPIPPVADAGTDQTITLPTNSVSLDGSKSTAPSGTITTYAWTKVSGPSAGTLSGASTVNPSAGGLVEGVYQYELTVTDNNGASASATVTITVKAAPLAPVADAGTNQTITLPTNNVNLDGSKSTAPSGTITTYAWTKVSGPADGTIANASSAGTAVNDLVEGVYVFELKVTDNNGNSATSSVTITVQAAPLPPVADAGADQTVILPKSSIALDGSDSYAQGAIMSYAWKKVSGPVDGIVASAFNVNTTVNGLVEGVYQFELTITDNNGATDTDTVTVTVKAAPLPPVANAGADQTITLPTNSVSLDGSASTAPSGTITSYAWTKVSGPSAGILANASTANASANDLVEGVYKFQLKVTDNNGATSTATITVTVKAAPLPPVANAGSAQTIVLPVDSVSVDGSASTAPSGSIVSYAWTKLSGPADGVINNASSANTSITGLTEGVYQFELKVTDNNGATSTATVTVTVKATPPPPVANAGNAQTITLPLNTVKLDGSKSSSASGTIVSYEWTKLSGPTGGTIASATNAVTDVADLVEGVYQFQLQVTDDMGVSATAVVIITVKAAPLPPVANAGTAQTITLPVNSVVLDATKSTAPAGQIKSYVWTKIAGPSTGIITNPTDATADVTGLIAGIYQFQVKVTDNNGNSSIATVSVTVNPEPHKPPVADAGDDQILQIPVTAVQLDGSRSYAREGSISTYSWSVVSGSNPISIVNATTVNPSILSIQAGAYVLRLKVMDTNGLIDSSDVQIAVLPEDTQPELPFAYIEADSTVSIDQSEFVIDGSSSYSHNGKIESYQWRQVSGPSAVVIENPIGNSTAIRHFEEGEYEFELTVVDNKGLTANTTTKIVVNNPGGRPDLSGSMSVFPNPTQSVVNIQMKHTAKGRTMMDVYDVTGKKVKHQEVIKDDISFNQKMDLSNLSRGVYFIEVIIDYKYRMSYRIVKQ
ncbi:MAG: PKD domain-containing protein [Agriterribacter sp.]